MCPRVQESVEGEKKIRISSQNHSNIKGFVYFGINKKAIPEMFSRIIRSPVRVVSQFQQSRTVSTLYKDATTTLRKDMKAAMLAKDGEK